MHVQCACMSYDVRIIGYHGEIITIMFDLRSYHKHSIPIKFCSMLRTIVFALTTAASLNKRVYTYKLTPASHTSVLCFSLLQQRQQTRPILHVYIVTYTIIKWGNCQFVVKIAAQSILV